MSAMVASLCPKTVSHMCRGTDHGRFWKQQKSALKTRRSARPRGRQTKADPACLAVAKFEPGLDPSPTNDLEDFNDLRFLVLENPVFIVGIRKANAAAHAIT